LDDAFAALDREGNTDLLRRQLAELEARMHASVFAVDDEVHVESAPGGGGMDAEDALDSVDLPDDLPSHVDGILVPSRAQQAMEEEMDREFRSMVARQLADERAAIEQAAARLLVHRTQELGARNVEEDDAMEGGEGTKRRRGGEGAGKDAPKLEALEAEETAALMQQAIAHVLQQTRHSREMPGEEALPLEREAERMASTWLPPASVELPRGPDGQEVSLEEVEAALRTGDHDALTALLGQVFATDAAQEANGDDAAPLESSAASASPHLPERPAGADVEAVIAAAESSSTAPSAIAASGASFMHDASLNAEK
jgi:hypothetical protein